MKLIGIILIAFSIVAAGFKAAARLTARRKILSSLLISFSEIAQRIRLKQERDVIISKVFTAPFQIARNGDLDITVTCPRLNGEDTALLGEFIGRLGMGDMNSQLELCSIYEELFKRNVGYAERAERQKAGMYRTCSLLTAAAVIILLI